VEKVTEISSLYLKDIQQRIEKGERIKFSEYLRFQKIKELWTENKTLKCETCKKEFSISETTELKHAVEVKVGVDSEVNVYTKTDNVSYICPSCNTVLFEEAIPIFP